MTVAVNGKAEENLNTEDPETEKDQKADTQLHVAVNGTIKAEPTDNQASGVLEEKAQHLFTSIKFQFITSKNIVVFTCRKLSRSKLGDGKRLFWTEELLFPVIKA